MAKNIAHNLKNRNNPNASKNRKKPRTTLQKPNGIVAPRVKQAGPDKFAFVCIDPAKNRSEWMMADFYGNMIIEPGTLEHRTADLKIARETINHAVKQHGIQDMIVTIERTGNYHRMIQQFFGRAGFEVRIVHPFATKQFRLPADPGNKTDQTDLFAQHRAACAGFGLCEQPLPPLYRRLRLRVRHRRDLVEKSSTLVCQIREHLHLSMPGYAQLFKELFKHKAALPVARQFATPTELAKLGYSGLSKWLREKKIHSQTKTVNKIVAWASQAQQLGNPSEESTLHQAIWCDLYNMYINQQSTITRLEREIAKELAATPYIRLLAIPGIHIVSAADFAGEMGPISSYANANAITGRSGLYPSRYQSDGTDNAGKLVRMANRSLRATMMRISDNLVKCNDHFRMRAAEAEARDVSKREIRVKISKTFSRLAFSAVAGDRPLTHPCCRDSSSIIEKLRAFHYEHETPIDQALSDMESAVSQLPIATRGYEAEVVAVALEQQTKSRRGTTKLGELLPSVLAKLKVAEASPQIEGPVVSD